MAESTPRQYISEFNQNPLQKAVLQQIARIPANERVLRSIYGEERMPHDECPAMFQLMRWALQVDPEYIADPIKQSDLKDALVIASGLKTLRRGLRFMGITPSREKDLEQEIRSAE